MLGDAVSVLLDGGPTTSDLASTILDCTGEQPRVLREGALSVAELSAVLAADGVDLEDAAPDAGPDRGPRA
jgi:tRNA A37 threonylcarbamoyladenosine synthetase subunit TsaC/SUA5/YrdC